MPKGSRRQRSDKGVPRGPRTMKKVSKKGAYKRGVKNQMMLRRAPLVETKQRVESDIAAINGNVEENDWLQPLAFRPLTPNHAFTFLPLTCFTRNSHGLEEWQLLGQNLTSKYLNVKTQFRFPNNQYILKSSGGDIDKANERNLNVMIQNQCRLYLICGWVTRNMGYPINNNSNSGPTAGVVTQTMIKNFITDQVKPYFDDDTDKLLFRPKETSNIKIEKYVRIKPNLNEDIATQAVPTVEHISEASSPPTRYSLPAHGSIPDVYRSHSFKTGRKMQLTLGQPSVPNNSGGYTGDTQNFYPNDSWLPFCIVYNPDWEEQLKQYADNPDTGQSEYDTQVCQIQVRHNAAHYYTDS